MARRAGSEQGVERLGAQVTILVTNWRTHPRTAIQIHESLAECGE
jgi:hypothetical protein